MSSSAPYKPRPISGFPEWSPGLRRVEQQWIDALRRVFESYGFCNIETPSVEELDVLLAKGETDKEIYTLTRLQADERDKSDARLGLHYDLTVPFARYVAQNFGDLVFPFRRYQIQKAWRGERPQEGRFREFYQADIDIIAQDTLPLSCDAEMPLAIWDALQAIGVEGVRLHLSNRKILSGALAALGVEDPIPAIRILDKLDKIGPDGVAAGLAAQGLADAQAETLLALGRIQTPDSGFADAVRALLPDHALLTEGLEELAFVMQALSELPPGAVLADLSIARGFDYYTGTVYEGRMERFPGFGSVVSGGRYDDLAGSFIRRTLPGVGISLGLSRLFSKLVAEGEIAPAPQSPSHVLVVLPGAGRLGDARATAAALRQRGYRAELFPAASKLKRQLAYAEKAGIPYVWFPPFEDGAAHEVKNMATGQQAEADPETWTPPEG